MDNFMDKLAKRFNAGELIGANAAAEERELQHAKERAAENDKMIQEIRRLNLKNVELTEQVQQLIRCGIEQFEEYDNGEIKNLARNEDLQQLRQQLLDHSEKVEKAFDNSQVMADNSISAIKDYKIYLEEITKILEMLKITSEETKAVSIESKRITEDAERIVSETNSEINVTKQMITSLKSEIDQIKEIVNKEDGIEDVTKMQSIIESQLRQISLGITSLEEHVHKENVKVYRNVQAVVNEQALQKAREINDRLDGMERTQKNIKGIVVLSVFTFLAAVASLVMQLIS